MKVGIYQLRNHRNMGLNKALISEALLLGARHGVDVAVFPECMLTGFSAKPEGCTWSDVESYIEEVTALAVEHNMSVMLPSILEEQERFFNMGWWISSSGECLEYGKRGLTQSEERFFTRFPLVQNQRIFHHGACRFGVVICREVADEDGAYFSAQETDIVLWPTYWRWDERWHDAQTVLARSARRYSEQISQLMIQCNYSHNEEDERSSGPNGRSVVIDCFGEEVCCAPEDRSVLMVLCLEEGGDGVWSVVNEEMIDV